jgi:cathepsin L
MKTLLVLASLFLAAFALRSEREYQDEFVSWMQQHQKSYHHNEFRQRFAIFKSNLDFIQQHNQEYEQGMHTFTVGINQFVDLTAEEFGQMYMGFRIPEGRKIENSDDVITGPLGTLPASWDWRDHGAVTHVKNQEQCGSCWSFSTTGSFEGCHQITTGSLASFSEQNLIDCSSSYGNEGCNGGLMTDAMDYIIANDGLDSESSYPYTASEGRCHYSASNSQGTMNNYQNVKSGDESALQQAVYEGPTSVAIDASKASFQMYKSGVYYAPTCSSKNLDHGVLAVGWGSDSGDDYWIVKNSWGTTWGQQGYIWMARNKNNNCGIATMATLPIC